MADEEVPGRTVVCNDVRTPGCRAPRTPPRRKAR